MIERPLSIGATLADLERNGRPPHNVRQFQSALRVLNQAAHGIDVDAGAASDAANVAARFLAELRAMLPGCAE
ncbi:hypothetical protein NKI82_29985 [Mesorhizobium sp. M0482]|uniref:hypothetical protein n=1 Tax=unclassified Mesorhizobium TaxID=325217 RepID=UPI00333654D7